MNAPAVIKKKKRLGEELIEKGLVTYDQVEIALTEQKKNYRLIGEILVSLGFVSESVMRDVLGKILGVGSVDLSTLIPDQGAIALIPKEIADRHTIIPVSFDEQAQQLKIAMKNASDLMVQDRQPSCGWRPA